MRLKDTPARDAESRARGAWPLPPPARLALQGGEGRISRVGCSPAAHPFARTPTPTGAPPAHGVWEHPSPRLPSQLGLPGSRPSPDPTRCPRVRTGGLETGSGEGRGKWRCPRVRTIQAGGLSRDCGKGHCLSGRSRRGSEEDRGSGRCQGGPVLLSIHLTCLPCTRVTLAEDPSPALACHS